MDSKNQTEIEELEKDEIEKTIEEIKEDSIEDEIYNLDIEEEKEPTKEFDINKIETSEEKEEAIIEDKDLSVPKKDNKKTFIILGVVALIVVIAVILLVVILNKDDDNKNEETKEPTPQENPNSDVPSDEECQQVMKSYGDKLVIYVRDYIATGHDVVTIKQDSMTNLVENYTVSCETFELENNGNVKLEKCSINNSDAIYNYQKVYGTTTDNDYELASKDGKLTFYTDGFYLYDSKDKDYEFVKKYTLKCEENSCVLDKLYAHYALVREESGKTLVYNLKTNEKEYTVLSGYEVNIVGKYDEDYNEEAIALTIRNIEKQEALYSLKQKKIVLDYGQYTYNWKSDGYCFDSCGTVVADKLLKVYLNKNIGLLDIENFELVLEPIDYDEVNIYRDYTKVSKGNYQGILVYDDTVKQIKTIIKPNKYSEVSWEENHILVIKSGKYGAFDITGEKQLLNGKFYDAVALSYNSNAALVLDGNMLKVLDLDGNVIKDLGQIPTNSKLNDDLIYGTYENEEEGSSSWLVVTNPNFNESANDRYNTCMETCDLDDYDECSQICDPYYNEEASHECIEYVYYYNAETLEKMPTSCEGEYAKPVLYLYPDTPTFVEVTFDNPNNLTTTYPKYKDSWNVLAHPNGDLYDLTGKYYYALYWEEKSNHRVDFEEGFYVTKNNAIEFLEEKLTRIGLNDHERNEFIMYWLPILEENEKNLVYFELTEERDSYSKINISPKPNSLLRLAIHIKKVDSYTKIKEQRLPKFERKGFTAVEWGGVLY